ncbi:hypothetical protein [Nocardioides okcheonensis]|uniref:hypothetical protein n=1 Tax=Nocardioides okcheonensis TaxID=2894081 RepID=UPI001E51AA26|nr:hypothetical protein [Nocardioides okcheonensis]UFN45226.1 hypothetical protein LN652_03140 [Nocardioides okcheonensis]
MNRVPDRLLRLVLNGPSAMAGLAIYMVVLAALPDAVALPVVVVLVAAMALPASGRVETLVARVVTGSRSASPDEFRIWSHVESLAEAVDPGEVAVGHPRLLVRRSARSRGASVAHAGRTSVVVSPFVLQGLFTGQFAVAAVAGEAARSRVEHKFTAQRGAVRGWFMTLPVRALAICLGPVLRRVVGWSLCRAAWHLRVVVGTVCVVDWLTHDRAGSGLAAGMLVLLSYVVPAARREASRRAASQAEVVRSAAARSQDLHESPPRGGHSKGPDRSHPVETASPTSVARSGDAFDRPRLYVVRTE